MAELAVAGSVVGLVSLSIQCCEGLTSYYSDYRSYSDEISQILQHIDELTMICCNLERELQGRAQLTEPASQHAIRLISSCRFNIQKLKRALSQCRTTPLPVNFTAKVQAFRARALYPFRKRTFQSLNEAIDSVQRDLGSALQNLEL